MATPAVNKQRYLRLSLILLVLAIVAAVIVIGVALKPGDYWPIVLACALGGLLAVAELVARYRDDPAAAVLSWPAAVYVAVNATAGGVALYLIHVFGWRFGAKGTARGVVQVLTAGLGSAALFRSSLFTVTAGDRVIGIGPSEILNVILAAADRAVDRQRALIRATRAAVIMEGLTFKASADAILAYCVATMQNVTPEEAREVEAKISALRDPKNDGVHDTVKSYILGLSLLSLVGDHVLTKAAEQLREVLTREPSPPAQLSPDLSPRPPRPRTKAEDVLDTLRRAGGAMPLSGLRGQVGLSLDESYIIDDLRQRGVISMEGETGSETVRITSPGGGDGQARADVQGRPAAPPGQQELSVTYFAYGSNMSPKVIAEACRDFRCLGAARLDGYRLDFTRRSVRSGTGVADIILAQGRSVWGVAYLISPAGLASLDRKEGTGRAYTQLNVQVRLAAGDQELTAVSYTVRVKKTVSVPPSGRYLGAIIEMARLFDFPEPYQQELKAVQTAERSAAQVTAD